MGDHCFLLHTTRHSQWFFSLPYFLSHCEDTLYLFCRVSWKHSACALETVSAGACPLTLQHPLVSVWSSASVPGPRCPQDPSPLNLQQILKPTPLLFFSGQGVSPFCYHAHICTFLIHNCWRCFLFWKLFFKLVTARMASRFWVVAPSIAWGRT